MSSTSGPAELDLTTDIIPASLCWLGHLLLWPAVLAALVRAPWWHLRDASAARVLLVACVGVLAVWTLGATVADGVRVHLLGAALLTLMFGWQFALLGLCLVALATMLNGHGDWGAFGVNMLVGALAPITVSRLVLCGAERWLPANYFVYIFVAAFLGGGLSMAAAGVVSSLLLLVSAPPLPIEDPVQGFAGLFLLLVYPEAFITGLLMSLFVVYKPHWVSSFDDRRYLRNR